MRLYECVVVSIWWYAGGGSHCLLPRHLPLCPGASSPLPHDQPQQSSGEECSHPITDTHTQWERDTSRWMIPPTTHRHTCRGTWHIRTHNSNLYSTSLHKRKFKCCRYYESCKSMYIYIHSVYIYIYTLVVFFQSVIHTYTWSHYLITEANSCIIYSRTLIEKCMHATIWMCGSQYMMVVEERGQGRGRLTLVLASR